jgi:hypothetical protein
VATHGIDSGVVHGVWRAGRRMVVAGDAEFLDRCVKTDLPAEGEWADLRLRWHHPALYLVLLVNIIVYFIVAYFASTSVVVHVGITHRALFAARRAWRLTWALVLVGLALCAAAVLAGPALLWGPGVALMVVAIPVFLLRARIVWPTRIEHGYVWLAGVHPDYLARLPEWPR